MKNNYFVLGFGLLTLPFFILLSTSILFILGFPLNAFVFPCCVFLSSLVVYYKTNEENSNSFLRFKTSFCFLLIIVFSLISSHFFWDYSYDGQSYHQNIIYALKNGWNPVWQHHSDFKFGSLSIWVDHYAKGIETIAASIYSTTGDVECGKAVNFILIIASFFFVFSLLKEYFLNLEFRKTIFISLLFSLSPVVICQFLTYYIDWSLYSLLLILISTLYMQISIPINIKCFIIAIMIFLSSAIKFNIVFFIGLVIFIYLIYLLIKKEYIVFKKVFFTGIITLILSLCSAGINPYITNTIDHENPFYPLVGNESVDIMSNQTPPNMRGKSRIEAILISLFSETNAQKTPAKVVFPFYLSKTSFKNSGQPDIRVGGFGVFFSGIIILSLILYVFSSLRDTKKRFYLNFTLLFLLLSIFILPAGWWARYVPFFYAIPIIMLLYNECSEQQNQIFKKLRFFIYCLMVLNIGISFLSVSAMSLVTKAKTDYYLEVIKESSPLDINFENNVAFKIKLDKRNVRYHEVKTQNLNLKVLGPMIYLKSEQLNFKKVDKSWLLRKLDK